jgi:hypothetical protein
VPIYVRVIATNPAGSATSNEIAFTLAPPLAPTLAQATVVNRQVTLAWTPAAGGPAATGYTVLARYPGAPGIIASLPVTGTTLTVPAPPGTYRVTVMAVNGTGSSAESNEIVVVVP